MTFSSIFPWLYLLALVVAGWRLYVIHWNRALKIVSGIVIVSVTPLLLLTPALIHPEREFASLLLATGLGMLVAGTGCLLGGMAGAWLRQRARKP